MLQKEAVACYGEVALEEEANCKTSIKPVGIGKSGILPKLDMFIWVTGLERGSMG